MKLSSQDDSNQEPLSEINITPLVDVVLVLLIIFMITTPMMEGSIKIHLPHGKSQTKTPKDNTFGTLFITKEHKIYLDEVETGIDSLDMAMRNWVKKNPKGSLYIKADELLPYGFVLSLVAKVKNQGVEKVAFVLIPSSK